MIKKRLSALRKLMKKNQIQAYMVPSTDPHQNEYLPEMWERRRWLSGFTGSAGDLIVTKKDAGLWTDSRYFLQAEEQLKGTGIQLFKIGLPETPSITQWLTSQLKAGEVVAIDAKVISYQQANEIQKNLKNWQLSFQPMKANLIDKIWKNPPTFPSGPIKAQPLKYSGKSAEEKLGELRKKLSAENCQAHVITSLDAIAWLFNIRGTDIPFNPLIISFALVTNKKALLFTPLSKINKSILRHFGDTIRVLDYRNFTKALKKNISKKDRVWLDPASTNWHIIRLLSGKCELVMKESPLFLMKAIKNLREIDGIKAAHVRDGISMVKFLMWLDNNLGKSAITEISASEKLEELRRQQKLYQGPSFHTISAFGAHAAIVHYAASTESDIPLKSNGLYLIDSGGQYLDGTTDITRTLALGRPTKEQKDRFTRVLQGHIRLATCRFPSGTAGNQLDTIARKSLWDIGLNYGHGTGHGIGAYLNVHEGPQAISYYRGIGVALEPGMVISNEPGYYKVGEYGIRIENLIHTIKDESPKAEGFTFNTFETITLCPIDLKLIEPNLLSTDEINWLNTYHKRVYATLSPLLNQAEKSWLKNETRAI
jgi:Xaa-Pro aminopeptidase